VLCCFGGATYDVITFLTKNVNISKNEKRHSGKENAILLYFEKPFKQAGIIFYYIGTLMT